MQQSATIFALSSGNPPSGVAVIRISGPLAKDTVRTLCGFVPPDRTLKLADIKDADGAVLDRGLVCAFTAPASFTGEDCAELHVHGGRASVGAILRVLGSMDGLRQAEAGEFTRRAFVNGKMDLTGAEGLSDLISAETEMQRRFALDNSNGRQRVLYEAWRERLLHARAMIEAELDFSDEGDVPGSVAGEVWADVARLIAEMDRHLEGARTGEILREGFRVVILGAPNAGKSSLLNRLADRDVAIVTDEPGTTRDLVEVVLDLDGLRTIVTDTAGLREQPGKVEAIGIGKALKRAEEADLVILLEAPGDGEVPIQSKEVPILRVASKSDLGAVSEGFDLAVSSVTGDGIGELVARMREAALALVGGWSTSAIPFRSRHVELVRAARAHLVDVLDEAADLELRAEALRLAGDELGQITGAIGTEEVLGAIFSRFCIGK
ncbi:MAG: tRNA uridine-5-carboxymethylaminomethyl(34) synthesis GTPase MnmE [Rhizobiaceae bacterium]|nr:tRNA uridine-5-carboxymethylaminomethyl(34) synthesis GTPase MnmE [Rhizobiaceae bacterium]